MKEEALAVRVDLGSGAVKWLSGYPVIRRPNQTVLTRTESPPTFNRSSVAVRGDELWVQTFWLSVRPLFVSSGDGYVLLSHDTSILLSESRSRLCLDPARVRQYYFGGPTFETICILKDVVTIPPGDHLTINLKTGKQTVFPSDVPPKGHVPIPTPATLCDGVSASIEEKVRGRNVAFALSGGVDSTLLAALFRKRNPDAPLRCYTVRTGAGNDLYYSRLAAKALKAELHEVELDVGEIAVANHEGLTRCAGAPIAQIGNSTGFGALCHAAAKDGFEAVVDGTGGGEVMGGRLFRDWLMAKGVPIDHPQRLAVLEAVAKKGRLSPKEVREYRHRGETVDYEKRLYWYMTRSRERRWLLEQSANACCHGLDVLMPFIDDRYAAFISSPPLGFYRDGVGKYMHRDVLAEIISHEVGFRRDKQGMRWNIRGFFEQNRRHVRRAVYGAKEVLQLIPWMDRLAMGLGVLGKGRLNRLYALSVYANQTRDQRS